MEFSYGVNFMVKEFYTLHGTGVFTLKNAWRVSWGK
jgi:C1A family cysteine protease